MSKIVKTEINCTCGIFNTSVIIRDYGDKIVVTSPYIKWVNNSGNLSSIKRTYKSEKALKYLREMMDCEELITEDCTTLNDIEYNYN